LFFNNLLSSPPDEIHSRQEQEGHVPALLPACFGRMLSQCPSSPWGKEEIARQGDSSTMRSFWLFAVVSLLALAGLMFRRGQFGWLVMVLGLLVFVMVVWYSRRRSLKRARAVRGDEDEIREAREKG
jgi:Flp pilus assembly protein TadB